MSRKAYLYGRASNQLETFHIRLDKTQLIILADSVCESLSENVKSQTRADLVVQLQTHCYLTLHLNCEFLKEKLLKQR